MTILTPYVSTRYRTGGQKRHLELVNELASRGYRIILIKEEGLDLPLSSCVRTVNLAVPAGPSRDRSFSRSIRKNLPHLLSGMTIDYEGTLLILQWGESATFSARVIKQLIGAPLMIALRNNWVLANKLVRDTWKVSLKSAFMKVLQKKRDLNRERLIARTADHLVFQSLWDRDAFLSRRSFPNRQISIIPNSTRAVWFNPNFAGANKSDSMKKILFIGNEDPRKGLEGLLRVFKRLSKEHRELSLEVMGRYPEKLIEEYRRQDLVDRVTFTGVQSSTLPALQKADLFIIPSLYDSFPNTLLEALFVGTPCCGARTAGIRDMLDDEDLLFTPGSEQEMENVLKKWLNPVFYSQKAAYCRTRAQSYDFDWTTRWEKILLN